MKSSCIVGTSILVVLAILILLFIGINIYLKFYDKKYLEDKLSALGFVSFISGVWIVFIIILSINEPNTIKLNEWGDFLAGYFAPILFIWLVYGVFLQKEEFGNIVESFSLQKEEFTKSVSAMESQVTQVEVQQLNTWFNRNIQTINTIKNTLFLNISLEDVDSILLINQKLKEDFKQEEYFFKIFDELKNILDIFMYMEEHLVGIKENRSSNESFVKAITDLEREFDVLYKEDYQSLKEIMSMVYILIECKTSDEYEKYKNYSNWVKDDRDIYNLILNSSQSDLDATLKSIFQKIELISQKMDFKTGVINGSIQ